MSVAGPALGDTYTLMELPRTPHLSLSERVVVAESQREKDYSITDTIDVGISKLIIASYLLKPTPKLVWSYPLSPSTTVRSMDVKSIGPDSNKAQLYVIGLTLRNASRLLLLENTGNETTATAELTLPNAAVAVKFSSGNGIYVLLANGRFLVVEYTRAREEKDEKEQEKNEEAAPSHNKYSLKIALPQGFMASPAAQTAKAEFHTFIRKGLFHHKTDLLFYAVREQDLDSVIFRLVALDGLKSFEIYQVSSSSPVGTLENKCAYSQGVLYTYDTSTQTIGSRSLLKPQEIVKQVLVAPLCKSATAQASGSGSSSVTLVAVASERLLLSFKSLVYLISFKFESLLSEHTNNSGNDVSLPFALPVHEKSIDQTSTFALYLNIEDKTKICKLKLIQVDVGLNLLSESLGKAISKRKLAAGPWHGFPHLAEDNLVKSNAKNLKKMKQVYKALEEAYSNKSISAFDAQVLEFLSSDQSATAAPRYSAETDRVVDHRFIEQVVSLLFSLDAEKNVQINQDNFVPQKAVNYLLTHPLFPAKYTQGLLVLLSALDQPELLKEAIKYCPVLTLDELMVEFTNLVDVREELDPENTAEVAFVSNFLNANIERILKDHSLPNITKKLLEVLSKEYDADSKRLERVLNVLININTSRSWTFVQAVIDVGGLFNWSVPTILALSEIIDSKIDALTLNSYILTLTNQAIVASGQKDKKSGNKQGSKKTPSRVVDGIHEIAYDRVQLDSILTMSDNAKTRSSLADESIKLAKQIPVYSRERLIL